MEKYLATCATSFEHYQNMLRTFFTLYTNAFFPFATSPEKDEKDSSSSPEWYSRVICVHNIQKNIWGSNNGN